MINLLILVIQKSMKKSILFGAICAAVLFIATFAACNSNEPQLSEGDQSGDDPYVELMQNLDDFHADYMESHPSEGSRGFLDFFRRLKKCVKADDFSFFFGIHPLTFGMTFSPSASYEAWCSGYATSGRNYQEDRAKVLQNESLLYQMLDIAYTTEDIDYGYVHNRILVELFRRCTPADSPLKIIQTASQVSQEMGLTGVAHTEIVPLANSLHNFVYNVMDGSNEVIAERMKVYCPAKAKEIDVIKNYFVRIENLNSVEEIKSYTEKYKEIIEYSNIPFIEKSELVNGLDIAPASMDLWSLVIADE